MRKLFKKAICMLLCFSMLSGIQILPTCAFEVFPCKHKFITSSRKVPVGTRLRFQTPPLQKSQKLCYTVGNGKILKTFVAGEPVQEKDGTVIYNLGYVCCKAGETGVYINRNGKPFMLYSVQVVDDKSQEGFPLSTSFGQIFDSQSVEKIVVANGNTGKRRQTTDAAKIDQFMAKIAPVKLYRNCDTSVRVGWTFAIDFYLKGQNGYYRYTQSSGFCKYDGFTGSLPIGKCVEESFEDLYTIIGDFYTSLN